jgi:short subunit dehydrogenase-like uncharacterized protein
MTNVNKSVPTLLIYGAAGYTGRLISQEAARRGLQFEIAGRDEKELVEVAKRLNVGYHVFSVDDQEGWKKSLLGKTSLLNVAGPFSATAEQAMDACIENKVNYIDISAEIDIYRLAESKDEAAKAAGIMILSGAGLFVSYDPLALHTAKLVDNPVKLRVAFKYSGGFTPGSIASSANIVNAGLLVRTDGQLVKLTESDPAAFDFGNGLEDCMLTSLGGTVLSYKSTGVKNIEEYFQMALPKDLPDSESLKIEDAQLHKSQYQEKSIIVTEVTGADGMIVLSKIEMEAGYAPTVFSSVEIAARTLDGSIKPGFQSPGSAYGEGLLDALPNVLITDTINNVTTTVQTAELI